MRLNYYLSDLLGTPLHEVQKNEVDTELFSCDHVLEISDMKYMTCREKGVGFVFDPDQHLEAIHLYGGGKDGVERFTGPLPLQIRFDDPLCDVDGKINSKAYECGGDDPSETGTASSWRQYDFENCFLHLEFNSLESIELITMIKKPYHRNTGHM